MIKAVFESSQSAECLHCKEVGCQKVFAFTKITIDNTEIILCEDCLKQLKEVL